jgi:phage major head subunit gpT-like protein
MTINTGTFGKALWPGVNKWYGLAYNEYPVEWSEIFEKHTSRKAWEEDISVSGFGLAQVKGEGQSIAYDTALQGFVDRYTHVAWGLGFVITKEMVEDDLYDVIAQKRAKALAFSARQTKEINGANILNRAFNTSYTYGDGKALIVSDHPNIAGGTWSNVMAVATDLSEAALEQAIIDISKYTNDRGLRIAVRPKKLIVHTDEQFNAAKIMETEYEVGTNNNTKNVVRSKFPGGFTVNHYLTDSDAWFLLTDVQDGLKYFERRADTFAQDDDFETDNAKFKFTTRYSFGATDKKAIYGTPGA